MKKNNITTTIRRIVTIGVIGAITVGSYLLGTMQAETITETKEVEKIVEVVPDGYIDMKSDEFKKNYVDMRKVVYFEVEDGLKLYYEDGNEYYWE